ncbi:MAG: FtsX-like permease family protein [Ruminococcaceae bacterium]|nr:FtsX-like permease family protein [Oscillospiraceae bacterium]
MFFCDYLRFSLKGIFSKKSRFFLTVLSIFVGVISVIVISAIGSSGQNAISGELEGLGLNGASIKSKRYNITSSDVEKVKDYLGGGYYVSSMSKELASVKYNGKDTNVFLCGGEPDALNILNMKVIYGRGIRDKDIEKSKNNMILSKSSAGKIFGEENCIGKKAKIHTPFGSGEYTVVGVVDNSSIYDMVGDSIPPFIYIPSNNFSSLFGGRFLGEISVVGKGEEDVCEASERAIAYLEKDKPSKNIFYYENMNSYKKSISNVIDIITLIITLVGAVSLIVGGISVMNTMLISVSERKREIGIKKAIGSTNLSIMLEFLIEALIIVLISCILGIAAGILISYLLMNSYGISLVIDVKSLLLSVFFTVFIGGIFGIYPAYKASRLSPVESLKN